jgi:hypothetical protein
MKLRILACLIFLISGNSFAQLPESKVRSMAANAIKEELVIESARLLTTGYVYHAEILVDRLLEMEPQSSNFNYRKGYIITLLSGDYIKALPYFEIAVLDTDPYYDLISPDEKSSSVDAYYYLGYCYHVNEQLDLAKLNYNAFLARTIKKSIRIDDCKLRLIQLEVARKLLAAPTSNRIINIGKPINTEFAEYSPVVSLDGSALYYTSKSPWTNKETDKYRDPLTNHYPEDIYVSYFDYDQTWTEPFKVEFSVPRFNEATIAVSADERRIYVYKDNTGGGDIYYSDFESNDFQAIKPFNAKGVNTKSWETHCNVSPDGRLLFFVSDRRGGYGGRDIYMCTKVDDDTWSKPINLGPKINTAHDEDAPFIAIDNKTLFFSSNGTESMGGFDIFKSVRNTDNEWSAKSVNLGSPSNSTGDDIFYTTTMDGLRGFITSYRKNGYGEKDIYEVQNDFIEMNNISILRGNINTVDNKAFPTDLAITIKCLNCDKTPDLTVYPRIRDGAFFSPLDPCNKYSLTYTYGDSKKEFHRENIQVNCDEKYQEIEREILVDVDGMKVISEMLELPDVLVTTYPNLKFKFLFKYNANKLSINKGELRDFVEAIEKQFEEGRQTMSINIYSSASHVPTKTYESNEKLSLMRAENMKYDLITYIQENTDFSNKVSVNIVSSIVAGPEYKNDAKNKEKYHPFQYVEVTTE